MRLPPLATTAASAALLLLTACGGGGGGSDAATPTPTDPAGAVAGAMAFGTVTAFGSVWVNGVEYDTATAAIRIDDAPGGADDLRVGMVVRVDGSALEHRATTVTVDSALKGRVEQVLDPQRLVVMGQTVEIDAQTRFENGAVPARGDWVEVHGLVAGAGRIAAGYIERRTVAATPPFAVKGLVGTHDPVARTLTIGALVVSYDAAAAIGDMPAGTWTGRQVEVKGSACASSPVCGTLAASRIEPDGLGVDDSAHTEFEGVVTQLTANGFLLGGQAVVLTTGTQFVGGVAADIGLGTRLEVEGPIGGGVLTASKVSLHDSARLEGDVASVDLAAGTLRLRGIEGVTVAVTSLTELRGLAALAALGGSQHVELRGREAPSGVVAASRLERRSTAPDSRVKLQGAVSAVTGSTALTVLGIVVDTSALPDNAFRGHDDAVIGRAAFFAGLKIGSLVKARGRLGGGSSVGWDELQRED